METTILFITIIVTFVISTLTDIILFKKLFRTKGIVLENNREIYDHDKVLVDIIEKLDTIQNG